jgi:aspartate/methionine/tyrosine aminotransferase
LRGYVDIYATLSRIETRRNYDVASLKTKSRQWRGGEKKHAILTTHIFRKSMPLPVFRLEDYLGDWEFKAPYLLCCSDAESWAVSEILALADQETTTLWNSLRLSYTEVKGLSLLRQEITSLYPNLNAEQILCFAGAEEGIYCAVMAILKGGDHAITIRPCYQSLEDLPRNSGAEVTAITLREDADWQLDLEEVESAIQPNTRIIFINYPHNPTGAKLNSHKQQALIELARKHDIIIFSDEVYRLLGASTDSWEQPIASLYEKGISLGVMSKAFGLAGLRVGWLACSDKDLLKQFEYVKHYMSICNSAPAEILSLAALRAKDFILKRNNEIVHTNINLLDDFMDRHKDTFTWVRPEGGCVGFVRYHGAEKVEEFCEKLVAATGVLLLPGNVYDWTDPHFRIGYGRKNMQDALARLEKYVSEYVQPVLSSL